MTFPKNVAVLAHMLMLLELLRRTAGERGRRGIRSARVRQEWGL